MSEVTGVKKIGDTYRVEGHVGDRKVSVDIHAMHVEGKSRGEADKFFKRSLRTVDEATRGR
jgi:hypothetical protein